MKNLTPRQRRWMRVRIVSLVAMLVVFSGAVLRRAWNLQVVQGSALAELARKQYSRTVKRAARRGTIYDRHGVELAVSVDSDSVWVNPRELRKQQQPIDALAMSLASVLDLDVMAVRSKLEADKLFVWLKRYVTPAQAQAVRAMRIAGIETLTEQRRYYPNREVGAHVIGMANVDGVGIEGIELSYDSFLRGQRQRSAAVLDRRGHLVFSTESLDDRNAQGDDVHLTMDRTLQHMAEAELSRSINMFQAKAGSIVVLEPSTGDILAMASFPNFNPNDPASSSVTARRNRAVTDRFEPGSTLKPFTVAAALDAGAISQNQWIDCEHGAMKIDRFTIHDTSRWGALIPAQILVHSSNIGAAKIGSLLGKQKLYHALTQFGFGVESKIPLPGETRGVLRKPQKWYEMDTMTVSFGQGMSVTALQIAMAMGALANGGRLMSPRLVTKVIDANRQVVKDEQPMVRAQAVRRDTAQAVAHMLIGVTQDEGTGVEAAIPGFDVAGKTGTAQKADYVKGGYADDAWVASFVGFAPANNPKLVISVVIDEPTGSHTGGTVAGSVFRRLGASALRYVGAEPDHPEVWVAQAKLNASEAAWR